MYLTQVEIGEIGESNASARGLATREHDKLGANVEREAGALIRSGQNVKKEMG